MLLDNVFKMLNENEKVIKKVQEVLRNVRIDKVKPVLNPLIVVGSKQLKDFVQNLCKEIKVQVAYKEIIEEVSKQEELVVCINLGEIEGCVCLSEPFEIYELVPDRFVGIFETFRGVLEAYKEICNLLADSGINGLLQHDKVVSKILSQLNSIKIERFDLESEIEAVEEEINKEIKRHAEFGLTSDEFKNIVTFAVEKLDAKIGLGDEGASILVNDALENPRTPFAFTTFAVKGVEEIVRKRKARNVYNEYLRVARELSKYVDMLKEISEELFELDFIISLFKFAKDYNLAFPQVSEEGIGFVNGRNLFLIQEEIKGNIKVQPVSYSIGKTKLEIFGAKPSNIVLLTGANSGGKTTLLMTIAQISIMTMLGLPVPAERAEVPLIPIYLFRRRTVRKIGSLEHALKSIVPMIARRERKLILIDEFEALTEPEAISRIIAAFLNNLPKNSLALFVTHLAGEIIPYLRIDFRVDGIEAKGVDDKGNLIVDRQPIFNRLGTSSPELIVEKLQKVSKRRRVAKAYEEMIKLLRKIRE
jgi:hypothetical protein